MVFELPAYAYEYKGPALLPLKGLKILISSMDRFSDVGIEWKPINEGWGGDYPVRQCESSLTGRGEMFGDDQHPTVWGMRYYEGVWGRQYHSLPNGILIFMPYPSRKMPVLVYTISTPMEQWIKSFILTYVNHVKAAL